MRHVLRHGRLAPSLHRLVGLLRDTLPIVAELEDMRVQAERDGCSLDTFAKSAGWYRVLYGDLRWDMIIFCLGDVLLTLYYLFVADMLSTCG
jgi:hypothetical protein